MIQKSDDAGIRLRELVRLALETGRGAIDLAVISAGDILVQEHLADMCREPRCGYYGTSGNCPPYVSGPPGFRDWLKSCDHALVIRMAVPMENLLSRELHDVSRLLHEIVAGIENAAVEHGYFQARAFATGGCKDLFCRGHAGCPVVTQGGECRHSRFARPSLSGFGINVAELTRAAGWAQDAVAGRLAMGALYGLVLVG